MSTKEIARQIEAIPADLTGSAWGFAFLRCFQGTGSKLPKSTFDRVKQGASNLADDPATEIFWKKRVYFWWTEGGVRTALSEVKEAPALRAGANRPMFIIIASPHEIAAHDLDQGEDLVISRDELPSHAFFFLPFAGKKKVTVPGEALEVDVKATRKMAVLFDEIRKTNPGFGSHDLNVFLARLLFSFYAEDTGIFKDNLFTESLASQTAEDGRDFSEYLAEVFRRFSTDDKSAFRAEFRNFPFVNGGLFEQEHPVPAFTKKSRKLLLENGEMDWKSINPDIFGSMFQVIVDPEIRHELGMHYTSRENIMKVISPLFLDALRADFEKAKGQKSKLKALHERIADIRVFDPACGSGNFLILAYEKLRELEMDILEAKGEIAELFPRIQINHFHGIEIDDFAHELAMLALWIKEHQMNLAFHERFHTSPEALPLREGGRIVRDNATRCDWNEVCPRTASNRDGTERQLEIYVLGNPPYLGAKRQEAQQKAELEWIAKPYNSTRFKNLDYISCWFLIASRYINTPRIEAAFVSTNSTYQGEHSALLWQPMLETNGMEIQFCHHSFKWKNHGAGNAGVTCIIVGFSLPTSRKKRVIKEDSEAIVSHINNYLLEGGNCWLWRRTEPVSDLPDIVFGSMPRDGGHLLLSKAERDAITGADPGAAAYIKTFCGAEDFLKKSPRFCLWIDDDKVDHARKNKFIRNRLEKVRKERAASKADSTNAAQHQPHRFVQKAHQNSDSIIFPSHTSDSREYIPLGFLDSNTVHRRQSKDASC